jgi:eukaryotic-like serine/threonine-protein kinase
MGESAVLPPGDGARMGAGDSRSQADSTDRPLWAGTDRYEVLRRIGAGGMGVVYEAFDREQRRLVAVKTLLNFTPEALYLFKNEFRTLVDVHHRNLVRLYELVATDPKSVFFAMELVVGSDFLTHVKGKNSQRRSVRPPGGRATMPVLAVEATTADFERLRPALLELAEGVQALHDAGKVHRDVKPSNVMVTPAGRVVLLDFGVATEVTKTVGSDSVDSYSMVGTAHYMAPEQAFAGESPTLASDWYSVGVMLYEVLVGRVPFTGSAVDVLTRKGLIDPPAPNECVSGVPPDLNDLCVALLRREPEGRPPGSEILHRLRGAARALRSSRPPVPHRPNAPGLVGRDVQLQALREAFDASCTGRNVTVRVGGRAGMGKSALLQEFLAGVSDGAGALVLSGRAYEREAMPYKAVDSVIDVLSHHLIRLADEPEPPRLPEDMGALGRLFAVLCRVPGVVESDRERTDDPQRTRRRAFAALRELLVVLSKRRPLVLFVDDVQWGDTDSVALLLELVRPPAAPPLLLVLAYREEQAEAPFLTELGGRWPKHAEIINIAVGPLGFEDARRLALRVLEESGDTALETAELIAHESAGSPFLIEELARGVSGFRRTASRTSGSEPRAAITLDDVVGRRLDAVPEEARHLLEVVAVGGRPLPVPHLLDALGGGARGADIVSLLRERRFVHVGLHDGRETVETIHDRIRETIVDLLPEPRAREVHRLVAQVLQAEPDVDPEAIAAHLLSAGDTERAGEFAERAAGQAAEKLAFEQAARLLRLRLQTVPEVSVEAYRLRVRLAQMLAWAGRSDDAGRVYLAAAAAAPSDDQRTDLERAAAAHLLASGHIDEGAAMLRRVLAQVGVKAPTSAIGAIFWLVVYRLLAVLRGVRFSRGVGDVPMRVRARLETLNTASMGYAIVDTILAGCMQSLSVLDALRNGNRFQVARATGLEGAFIAAAGQPLGSHERRLFELSERLTEEDGSAESRMAFLGAKGFAKYMRGDWREALMAFDAARAATPAHLAAYEANTVLFGCYSLLFLGRLHEFEERQARHLAEAIDRGDFYTSVQLRVGSPTYIWLAKDDPETARRHSREAMAEWSHARFLTQHWQAMYSDASIELYVGAGSAAYARLKRDERALKRTMLAVASGHLRVLTMFLRGRSAIASITQRPELRSARTREARRLARRLMGEKVLYARVFGAMLDGSATIAADDAVGAVTALRLAIELAERAEMPLYAASARLRLASLLAGCDRTIQESRATAALCDAGVRDPHRFVGMLVPMAPRQPT